MQKRLRGLCSELQGSAVQRSAGRGRSDSVTAVLQMFTDAFGFFCPIYALLPTLPLFAKEL